MRSTRRRLLLLTMVGAVAGCAPDPTVRGTPGSAPEPVVPTRTAEAEAAAVWVEQFAALVEALLDSASSWDAEEVHTTWLTALQAQSSAHLSRVVTEDPVIGGHTVFPVASPAEPPSLTVTSPAETVAALTAAVAEGVPLLLAATDAADDAPERLFYASLTAAATASLSPARPPVEGGAEPAPFDAAGVDESLAVALSHVWAMVRGVELGLGRLSSSDELQKAGVERLDGVRGLRNELLAALSGDVPDVQVWELPNAMSTATEIRAAWAVLEANLLGALGALAATTGTADAPWLESMLGQVAWVHQWGGRLPHWPGWVATS